MSDYATTDNTDKPSPHISGAEQQAAADAVSTVADPVSMPKTAAPETFQIGRNGIQSALIAVLFLVIGFVASTIVMNSRAGLSAAEVEAMVRVLVAEQIAASGIGGPVNSITLVDDDPSFGPDDAVVTIVEFSDFFCTYCTRFATETLPRLRERYGEHIRFVYRDMPIIAGQASVDAAIAGNCAFEQNKFWEFHDILFSNNNARARENFISFAGELGMATDQFETCLDDPSHMDEITLDVIDGQTVGVTATPKFFVNGKIISGAQSYETFALVIETELEKAGISMQEDRIGG